MENEILNAKEHVRRRPGMYIGDLKSYGYLSLLKGMLENLLSCSSEKSTVELTCYPNNRITVKANNMDTRRLGVAMSDIYTEPTFQEEYFFLEVYAYLCSDLSIHFNEENHQTIFCSRKGALSVKKEEAIKPDPDSVYIDGTADSEIFRNFEITYAQVNSTLQQFAYLNPAIKIITVDRTSEELQRNVFHYSKGVIDQLSDLILMARPYYFNPPPLFEYISLVEGYEIRIGADFRSPKDQKIMTFGNIRETPMGGTLLDATLAGIISAIKQIAFQQQQAIKINKRSVRKGLLLFAAIRGKDLKFGGAARERLLMPKLKAPLRKMVHEAFSTYLLKNENVTNSLIGEFGIWPEDNDE